MPAQATSSTAERTIKIGSRLRAARLARHRTIEQVADAAGLTKGFLSRLERDDTSVSIASLFRICDVLGIKPGSLFEAADAALIRRADVPVIEHLGRGLVHGLLTPAGEPSVQVVRTEIAPGGDAGSEEYAHRSQVSFFHVLSGEIELDVEDQRYVLRSGDSLTFPATAPRTYRNRSKTRPARVLSVTAPAP